MQSFDGTKGWLWAATKCDQFQFQFRRTLFANTVSLIKVCNSCANFDLTVDEILLRKKNVYFPQNP